MRSALTPNSEGGIVIIIEENRQEILDALLPALKLTRAGQFVESLTIEDKYWVKIAEYVDGIRHASCVNIGCDSGAAMILDIVRELMR